MPLPAIIAYLRGRGYTVSARPFSRADRLLAPMADEDGEENTVLALPPKKEFEIELEILPFDGEDRRP